VATKAMLSTSQDCRVLAVLEVGQMEAYLGVFVKVVALEGHEKDAEGCHIED
jgi:hypothetical protein